MSYIDKINIQNTQYEICDTNTKYQLDKLSQHGDTALRLGLFEPGGINSQGAPLNGANNLLYYRRSKDFIPITSTTITLCIKNYVGVFFRFFDNSSTCVGSIGQLGSVSDATERVYTFNPTTGEGVASNKLSGDLSTATKYKIVFFVNAAEANLPYLTIDNFYIKVSHPLVTTEELNSVKEKIGPNVWGLFHNAVCIGDSLTRGFYSYYDSGQRNRDYGYPNALARLTGMQVWNFGLSGADPGEWLNEPTFAQENYSKFDVAFIAFGQNLTDSNDVAYTEAQYETMYLNVLQKLKTARSDMVIFCLSNPGPATTSREWIEHFVTAATDQSGGYKYTQVYYLDITTDAPYLSHRTDGTHLDAIGYSLLAETIKIAVEKLYESIPLDIYIPKIKPSAFNEPISGAEHDVLDKRIRLADGSDFDYGELKQGGINSDNAYTTGNVLRRSETYWPVIEGPVNIIMSNDLVGYIRLYDSSRRMIDPDEGKPGANSHYIIIAKNSTLTLTMKEYNPNTAYFRFYFSCGTEDNISALVRENARIVPLQTVASYQQVAQNTEDITNLKSYARATYLSEPDDRIWEQGSITAGTGADSSPSSSVNSARIRTSSAVDYFGAVIDEDYEAIIYAYDTNDVYIGSWNGNKFTTNTAEVEWFSNCSIWFDDINPAYNYKLVVRKVSEEDILPSENSHVKFISKTAGQRLDDLEGAVKSLGDLEKNRGLTPAQLQAICASGHAPDYFDIGDIIYIDWTDYSNADNPVTYHVPHVVVHFGDVEDPYGNIHRNGMYLMWMYGTPASATMVYDAPEQIVADEATFQSGYYYYTRNDDESFTEQEVTVGDAIPSGTTYYKHYRSGMTRRLQFGSDDYSQSAYRQWLNSTNDDGEWWTPQHISDRAPLLTAPHPGFMKGYSSEWLAIFKPIKVQTIKDTVADNNEIAVTYDTFFLPSVEQMYGSPNQGVEGVYWEYWKDATGLEAPAQGGSTNTNEARQIRRVNSETPNHIRLRTIRKTDVVSSYVVNPAGYITYQTARNAYSCQPTTVIY